ncbi:Uncharacterised protein [Sphingobacterium mizutaii]|uniref:Uncharacterized protein n=1 Tax=Sphingobacterium mizutaii TaxID=1010 RepID=A0AAJ5C044_9SPHI|nr:MULTISPECIES: hypothetical protein [Sphingobacterium]SDK97208.1 hypothetical protein SAMN05192578_101597 [Sphingobacterium mizutaii]SNV49183.1 Uncharacterised protein [Sphingobacterium mizutaii]
MEKKLTSLCSKKDHDSGEDKQLRSSSQIPVSYIALKWTFFGQY